MACSTVGQTRSAPCLAELQAWLEASPALLSVKLPADAIQYTLTRDVGDGGQSMLWHRETDCWRRGVSGPPKFKSLTCVKKLLPSAVCLVTTGRVRERVNHSRKSTDGMELEGRRMKDTECLRGHVPGDVVEVLRLSATSAAICTTSAMG